MRQKGSRPEQDPATAFLVRIGDSLLYVGMALMPINGSLTMLGGGNGWSAFGIELVAEGGKIPWMASLGSLHSRNAWSLLILIVGHRGIALLHHLLSKADVLGRRVWVSRNDWRP